MTNAQISYEWIDTASGFEGFLGSLNGVDRIGIDTEFHRERSYWPELALVQIAAGERNVLLDPLAVNVSALADLITGTAVTVMHASDQDLEMLYNACGAIPSRLFDVQIAAGFNGMSTPSLSTLVANFTKHKISKGNRLTNWLQRPLSQAQCQYAASDVAFLFEITDRLLSDLAKSGRTQWALDECEQARKPPPPPQDPDLAWFKIKAARQLRGKARAAASTLAAWRELTARKKNLPPRFVLSDLALVAIAQRQPKTDDELKSLRGVQGSLGKSHTKDVLEAVRCGAEMRPENVALPERIDRPELAGSLRSAVPLISAWLDGLAHSQHLDRTLLATRNDVELLLMGDEESRLAHGWRADLVGSTVTDLVAGRASIAFDKAKGLSVEPRSTRC